MALKINITNNKGIITEYHRISKVEIMDMIAVTVSSYAEESYRLREKEMQGNIDLSENLNRQILEEMQKEVPDTEMIIQLSNQLNSIHFEYSESNYAIHESTEEFNFNREGEISLTNLYNQLKELEKYKDAEDV